MNATVYVLGIILQAVAALIALVQVRHAPRRLPWLLIAFSSLLIVARRAAALDHSVKAGMELAMAEVLTLVISLLFFLGVVLMSRMFKDAVKKHNELIESEEKYRTLHQSMMDAFVSVDMEGSIIDYNDAYLNMLGYTPEEISKLSYKHITPEKWHKLEAAIVEKQVLTRGYSDIYEKEYRRKDGTVFPVEIRTTLMRDTKGAPISMWAIARDLTQRRQTMAALSESEKRFSSAFDFAAIGKTLVSTEGTFIRVNKALCNILGYTPEELTALTFQDITHPDDLEKDLAYVQQMLTGEIDTYQMEKRYFGKQGNLVWVLLSVSLVHDEQNKPQYFISQIQDITDRKQAEDALKRSQKLLAETEKVGKVGGWELNIDTGEQTWTEEIYNIHEVDLTFGPTLETGINFYTPTSFPIIDQAVKRAIENNEPFDLELEIITAKGNIRHVHAIGKPDLDHRRVYGFFQDITSQKVAAEAIRAERDLLQAIMNAAKNLHLVHLDRDFNFIHVNEAYAATCGYIVEEMIGKNHFTLYPDAENEAIFSRVRDTGVMFEVHDKPFEFPDQPQRGVTYWDWTLTPIKNSADQITGLVFSLYETTQRKQVEEEIRRRDSKYRELVEHAQDGIFTITVQGQFLFVNAKFCQMLGYALEECLRRNILDTYPDDMRPVGTQRLADLQSGQALLFERPMKRKDGGIVLIEAIAWKDSDGNMQAIVRDITKRKQAEAEKAALESQNRQLQKTESLGRMAAAIAHHFNNQLGVVIGNLEMAIDEQPKDTPPSKSLTSAMDAAWRSADMSGLMLTYLGQSHNERKSLDLSYSCRKILPLIKTSLPGNVVMETDFPSPRPTVMANAGEIQQVLTNLITNAREAIGNDKGTIALSIKTASQIDIPTKNRFPVDWESLDKTFACLEVTDTGCGIEDKDIEKLFDPFYSTKFTGRGMGLAVVLGLANSYKGVITVDSKPGSGSTFRIFFPVSEEALPQPQTVESDRDVTISKSSSKRLEEGGTVLVVEDETMLRDMAAAMLESFGFIVLKAKDGVEALDIFGKHQSEIKFVLTDLTMPRMNGWDTLTELRKLQPNIPVILASGYDLAHVMEGDHPELPQAFLAKPYNLKALRDAISQTLESRKG